MKIKRAANLLPPDNVPLECLKNNKKPVIVFGKITKNGEEYENHAVFAYGYTSTDQVIVHYGHPGYSEVVLVGKYPFVPSMIALKGFQADDIGVSDVATTHWGYTAIQYCTRFCLLWPENNKFRPEDNATRLDFVVALYKLAGEPDPKGDTLSSTFVDPPSKRYGMTNYNAAQWAVENGILTGISSNTLGLEGSLTREQAAVFIRRYATHLGCTFAITSGPAYSAFDDYRSISQYAISGVNWATRRYLLRGDNGMLYPLKTLTRAETAQLIYNLTIRAER